MLFRTGPPCRTVSDRVPFAAPDAANGKVTTARKRKRPSLCGLRTWTTVCDAMRLLAKVAEEGLEAGVNFRGKTYTLAIAGDSRGIIRAEHL